jgi:hypothetical protein
VSDAIEQYVPQQLVPAGYAEKAMASLMQLHSELMDEKERRVDLFRRLMEREQALAELRMYVKILEEKMAKPAEPPPAPVAPRPQAVAEARRDDAPPVPPRSVRPATAQMPPMAPMPPRINARRPDGWKVW